MAPQNATFQSQLQDPASGFMCFTLEGFVKTDDSAPPRKRAKSTPRRRQEVASLRGKACLRCKLLKLRCSGDNPCQTCLNAAIRSSQSKQLQFSYCIRASLKSLSIFAYGLPSQDKVHGISRKAELLISTPIELQFPVDFEWDLDSLARHIFLWLEDPEESTTSKVGILCSPGFQDLVSEHIGQDLSSRFQQMLYACTMAHTQSTSLDNSEITDEELRQITSVAGEHVLSALEKRLTPAELEKCSLQDLQALFLILLGTILAVGYSTPDKESIPLPVTTVINCSPSKTLHEALQEHLCAILAHYMVYLSHKMTTSLDPNMQERLITKAHERWEAKGQFRWMTFEDLQEPEIEYLSACYNMAPSMEPITWVFSDGRGCFDFGLDDAYEPFLMPQEGDDFRDVIGSSSFASMSKVADMLINLEDINNAPNSDFQFLDSSSMRSTDVGSVYDFAKDSALFSSPFPSRENNLRGITDLCEWEKALLRPSIICQSNHTDVNEGQTKILRKRRQFLPERSERVRRSRSIGACVRCRVQRTSCMPVQCERCRRQEGNTTFPNFNANSDLLRQYLRNALSAPTQSSLPFNPASTPVPPQQMDLRAKLLV